MTSTLMEIGVLNEENGNGISDQISTVNPKWALNAGVSWDNGLNEGNGANSTTGADTVEHRDSSPLPEEHKKEVMYFGGRAFLVEDYGGNSEWVSVAAH